MMHLVRTITVTLALGWVQAGAATADIVGLWMTKNDESKIELFPCGEEICGRIVWISEPDNPDGTPKRDFRNPDETLRSRTLLGLQLINGYKPSGPDKWKGGTIYSPRSGKTHKLTLKLPAPDQLKVCKPVLVACVGQTWRRAERE